MASTRGLVAERQAGRLLGVVGLALAAIWSASVLAAGGTISFADPYDLDLNLVAAQRFVDGEPLYDRAASRAQSEAVVGTDLSNAYTYVLDSYPSPPSTALFHVPFLAVDHDTAVLAFRWTTVIGMLGSVVVCARSLPRSSRLPAAALGAGVLVSAFAFLRTLALGQGHEWVMLGVAVACWAASKERWKLAGIGLGVAAALKLSPALLIAYLLLRGKRQAVASAAATVAVLTAVAALLGRPGDLVVWIREVLPAASGATFSNLNQSLPALLARATSSSAELHREVPLGPWRYLALPLAAAGALWLWRRRRGRPVDPLELGLLVLVVLLVGPLTWEHYAVWAALPVVLLADPRRWAGRSPVEFGGLLLAVVLAALLLTVPIGVPDAAAVRADWLLRLTSSPQPVALGLLLLAGVRLLDRPASPAPPADRGTEAAPVARPHSADEALLTGSTR